MNSIEMKKCTKCCKKFPATLEFFYKQKHKLHPRCKICVSGGRKKYSKYMKDYYSKYYEENKEVVLKMCEEYRDEHKDEKKKYNHEYGVKNKKAISINKREYSVKNKEKIRIKNQKHHKNNKKRINANCRKYYRENKEYFLSYNRSRRALKIVDGVSITSTEWANKVLEYDGKCAYCDVVLEENIYNIYNPNGISEDHVIALTKGGKHKIENLVPCCRDCNGSKYNKIGKEFDMWLKEKIIANLGIPNG